MERDPFGLPQVFVQIELDLVFGVVDQAEQRYRTRHGSQAAFHPLLGGEGEFALVQLVFQAVDVHLLVAFQNHQIVPVAFMISEKEVLAVGRIEVFPVFHRFFDGGQGRMLVHHISDVPFLELVQYFLPSGFCSFHKSNLICFTPNSNDRFGFKAAKIMDVSQSRQSRSCSLRMQCSECLQNVLELLRVPFFPTVA